MEFSLDALIGMALTALFGWIGGSWKAKKKAIASIAKEGGEALTALGNAVMDDNVTKEEVASVLKEAKDVGEAIGNLRKSPNSGG